MISRPAVAGIYPATCPGAAVECADVDESEAATLLIQATLGSAPVCGFRVIKSLPTDPDGQKIKIEADGPCSIVSNYTNPFGNTAGNDLLPTYMVQVDPNGVNGNVTFEVFETPTSTALSFVVNTTGKTLNQIQTDVMNGFNGLALTPPLTAVVDTGAGNSIWDASIAADPNLASNPSLRYAAGNIVRITNAGSRVCAIHVTGLPGQLIHSESNDPNLGNIPTLSEWGMIIVAMLLLASGYWLFRRQRTTAVA